MSTGERRPRAQVEEIAGSLLRKLIAGDPGGQERACSRGMIVGSMRRGADMIGDIELVLQPWWVKPIAQPSLFGGETASGERQCPLLDRALQHLIRSDWLSRDERSCWGQRLRRLRLGPAAGELAGFGIELYLADPDNYGNLVTLRTGDEEFTRPIFTQLFKGGMLPRGVIHADGFLWLQWPGARRELIPCPTEEEFFRRIKIDWVRPEDRNAATIARLREELRIPAPAPTASTY